MDTDAILRRDALRLGGLSLLGFHLADWTRAVADDPPRFDPLNRFPRMVQEAFVDRVRTAEAIGEKRRAALATKADAEAYVRATRERIATSFGPMPERTPLEPRITGVLERDGYRVEKLIYESRPGFLVTANVYVPTGPKGRMPAVVGTCGHSTNGKAEEAYQSFAQGLARLGYVCLIYDPIGQGERLQYVDAMLKSTVGVGVREHLMAGNQQFLVGEFLGAWRAWDGIRALDYLLTRDDVDPNHVGVTGNSGGGTMTTWLCGVEQRWTMAAPSCFVTTFRRNLENELPADTEQCPPRALELGLDHSDFLAALAPKPIVVLAKERDYFDVRGSEEAVARLRRLYELLGRPDDVDLFVGPTYHGYSQENREAMYRWFNRVTGVSEATTEPSLKLEEEKDLLCTPNGQVAGLNSRTVIDFTMVRSRELAESRGKPVGDELRKRVRDVLAIPAGDERPPRVRILRPRSNRGYPKPHLTAYAVESEPGIRAVAYRLQEDRLYSRPPRERAGRAILYVSHHSADAELRDEPLIAKLLEDEPQSTLYTLDVRGVGESRPNTCGENSFLQPYGCDYFYAVHSLMLGRPYVGGKTRDVLRTIDWLRSVGHTRIHLAALGWGALPATFAATLREDETVDRVTLKRGLDAYSGIAESKAYSWPLSSFAPNVLAAFDLPDCRTEIARAAELRVVEPVDASGQPLS